MQQANQRTETILISVLLVLSFVIFASLSARCYVVYQIQATNEMIANAIKVPLKPFELSYFKEEAVAINLKLDDYQEADGTTGKDIAGD